jgi:uncharacterized repeat protein (TIGR04076 family)
MIKVTVVSIKGTCIFNHQIGDTVTIDERGVHGDICIHALYSMLPKAFAMLYGAEFPWLKQGELPTHACPDGYNPVIWKLEVKE